VKIEATFCDHWKTKRLIRACGAEAVVGLLRLWGHAQTRREYAGLTLNPVKLAGMMDYSGDEKALWDAMTDQQAPWLDEEPEGTWAIHGFAEHNRQLIHLWGASVKGGRPPKDNTDNTILGRVGLGSNGSHMETICKPYGSSTETVVTTPTLEEFKIAASMIGVEEAIAEEIWHDNEGRAIAPSGHWTGYNGQPIHNWRSNMKARASAIARKRPSTALTKPKGVWDAKQGIEALKAKLERMKGDSRLRQHKAEMPWETEWKPEAKAEVARIRQRIAELEGVVAA
jgi:hypothetical protein